MPEARRAVFETDLFLVVTKWDAGAELVFGWTADEVVGLLVYTFLNGVDSETSRTQRLVELQTTGRFRGIVTFPRKDGELVTVDVRVQARTRAGKVVGYKSTLTLVEKSPHLAGSPSPAGGQVPNSGTFPGSPEAGQSPDVEATQRRELVGENIRQARTAANLTQAQLGDRLGVHRTRVADWERGARGVGDKHLEDIVEATGAPSFGWFFDEHEWPEPE